MFDFNEATIESGSEYVKKPGFYYAKVTDAVLTKPEDTAKNPYLTVTFETEEGSKVSDKFFITQKALGRLKALFKGVWAKDLDKTFKNVDEVSDFFKAALLKKQNRIGIRVLLEEANNGQFYARMPFNDFISFDIDKFESRVIEPSDPDYVTWILKARAPQAPKNENSFVDKPQESWSDVTNEAAGKVDDSDLPF